MDKNSLILEIKNDLNSIKKQVEVTLAKIDVLEALIKLEVTSGARKDDLGAGQLGVKEEPKPEPKLEPVVEPEPESIAEPEPIVEPEPEEKPEIEVVVESEPKLEQIIEEEVEEEKLSAMQMISGVAQQNSSELDSAFTSTEIPNSSLLTPNSNVELRNLMSVIGLNDRFRFRHDLFSNSDEIFRETIDILNKIENFDKAVDYLMNKFEWDEEDATVVYFYDIIKPKF